MKPKYLLVWDRIGDYHRSRWKALAKIAGLTNVFGADLGGADGLYKWENTSDLPGYALLSEKPVEVPDFDARFKAFKNLVNSQNISVLGIAGYGRKEYLAFLAWAWLKNKKVVLFAESWYGGKSVLNTLKGQMLKRCCKGFLVSGALARDHFINNLGIDASKIRIGYSVVDNAHFASAKNTTKTGKPILLCVARFSPEKNLENLIKAFLASELKDRFVLKLVGGGPLKTELEKLANANPNIIISPWLGYPELPALYASATWFILPSVFEPWGLVVNEAMAAGLPIILSNQCGCHPDLLGPDNGFLFETQRGEGPESLIKVLNLVAGTPEGATEIMGQSSAFKIRQFSPETWANSFIELSA